MRDSTGRSERTLALIAFATICIVWGTTYLAIRIAIETIPPLVLTSSRFVIAGVVMLAIALARGERIPRDASKLANLTLIGFLMVGVGNLAVVWAEQWVPSGLAALLVATAPFWMVVVELFRTHGERADARTLLGMVVGFVGVAMLVTPGGAGPSWDMNFVLGALAIQVGSLGWQIGSVRGKYYLRDVGLMMSSALQMLFGGVIVAVIALMSGEASRLTLTPRTFAAAAYLTVFGSIIAYSAYTYALAHIRTTQMSIYAYINPAVAVFLGWLILDETLTWVSIAAMAIILSGVALVQTRRPAAT